MLLRHPVARLVSFLSFFAVEGPIMSKITSKVTPSQVFTNLPIVSNNFFIRSLLGKDVYHLPFGSTTSAHLEDAKQVLERFDVLLVSAEGNNAYLDEELGATLG